MDKSINEKILLHHQKVIAASKRLLNPSKEEKQRLTRLSTLVGMLLILLSLPALMFNRFISLGLIGAGVIQLISCKIVKKYW